MMQNNMVQNLELPPGLAESPQFGAAQSITQEGLPAELKRLLEDAVTLKAVELVEGGERAEVMDTPKQPSIKTQTDEGIATLLSSLAPGIQQRGMQLAEQQQRQAMGMPGQPINNMRMAAQGGIVGYADGGSVQPIPALMDKYGSEMVMGFLEGEKELREESNYVAPEYADAYKQKRDNFYSRYPRTFIEELYTVREGPIDISEDLLMAEGGIVGFAGPQGSSVGANNPYNIRDYNQNWEGQSGATKGFVNFGDEASGVRAADKLLENYQTLHGISTVREVIARFAPPNENITEEYIEFVANKTGLTPDQPLNLSDPRTRDALLGAMGAMESGYGYDENILAETDRARPQERVNVGQTSRDADAINREIAGARREPTQVGEGLRGILGQTDAKAAALSVPEDEIQPETKQFPIYEQQYTTDFSRETPEERPLSRFQQELLDSRGAYDQLLAAERRKEYAESQQGLEGQRFSPGNRMPPEEVERRREEYRQSRPIQPRSQPMTPEEIAATRIQHGLGTGVVPEERAGGGGGLNSLRESIYENTKGFMPHFGNIIAGSGDAARSFGEGLGVDWEAMGDATFPRTSAYQDVADESGVATPLPKVAGAFIRDLSGGPKRAVEELYGLVKEPVSQFTTALTEDIDSIGPLGEDTAEQIIADGVVPSVTGRLLSDKPDEDFRMQGVQAATPPGAKVGIATFDSDVSDVSDGAAASIATDTDTTDITVTEVEDPITELVASSGGNTASSGFQAQLDAVIARQNDPMRAITTFLRGMGEGETIGEGMQIAGKALESARRANDAEQIELLKLLEAGRISEQDFELKRLQIQNEKDQIAAFGERSQLTYEAAIANTLARTHADLMDQFNKTFSDTRDVDAMTQQFTDQAEQSVISGMDAYADKPPSNRQLKRLRNQPEFRAAVVTATAQLMEQATTSQMANARTTATRIMRTP